MRCHSRQQTSEEMDDVIRREREREKEEDQRFSSSLPLKAFLNLTDIEPVILVDKISCVNVFLQIFLYYL